jgi:hypothetical protein
MSLAPGWLKVGQIAINPSLIGLAKLEASFEVEVSPATNDASGGKALRTERRSGVLLLLNVPHSKLGSLLSFQVEWPYGDGVMVGFLDGTPEAQASGLFRIIGAIPGPRPVPGHRRPAHLREMRGRRCRNMEEAACTRILSGTGRSHQVPKYASFLMDGAATRGAGLRRGSAGSPASGRTTTQPIPPIIMASPGR